MNKDRVLDEIYNKTKVSLYAMPKIKSMCKDKSFSKFLNCQEKELSKLMTTAEKMMKYDTDSGPGAMTKFKTACMVRAGTLTDKSVPNLASMVIINNTQGMVDVKKALNSQRKTKHNTAKLAAYYLRANERNNKILNQYL